MTKNRARLTASLLALGATLLAVPAWAATVSIEPESSTVGVGQVFLVDVKVSSDDPVDAVSLVLDVPRPLQVADASDGGSIVNLWVDRPHVTEAGTIALSGIVPGGFSGVGRRVVTLSVVAPAAGTYRLAVGADSKLYGGEGVPIALQSSPVTVVAVPGRGSSAANVPDQNPPEPFSPVLVQLGVPPRWVVAFATQDEGSGVSGYEVAETSRDVGLDDEGALDSLDWRSVESPAPLADQGLASNVYVRARDRAGLWRVEKISASGGNGSWRWWVSACTLLLALIAFIYARRKEHSPR